MLKAIAFGSHWGFPSIYQITHEEMSCSNYPFQPCNLTLITEPFTKEPLLMKAKIRRCFILNWVFFSILSQIQTINPVLLDCFRNFFCKCWCNTGWWVTRPSLKGRLEMEKHSPKQKWIFLFNPSKLKTCSSQVNMSENLIWGKVCAVV